MVTTEPGGASTEPSAARIDPSLATIEPSGAVIIVPSSEAKTEPAANIVPELGAKADCCPDANVSEVVMIADSAAFTMIPPWVALELVGRVLEAMEVTEVKPGGREEGNVCSTAPCGSTRGVPSSVVRIEPSAGLIRLPSALVIRPSGTERTVPSAEV